jgi:hypothetical protein
MTDWLGDIPIADQNFGTNRFVPLYPKSVHKRAYSIDIL